LQRGRGEGATWRGNEGSSGSYNVVEKKGKKRPAALLDGKGKEAPECFRGGSKRPPENLGWVEKVGRKKEKPRPRVGKEKTRPLEKTSPVSGERRKRKRKGKRCIKKEERSKTHLSDEGEKKKKDPPSIGNWPEREKGKARRVVTG